MYQTIQSKFPKNLGSATPCTKPSSLNFLKTLGQLLHVPNHPVSASSNPSQFSHTKPSNLSLTLIRFSFSMYQTIQTRFIPSLIQLLHVPNHPDLVYPKPYSSSPCTKPFRLGLSQALFSFSMYQTIQTRFIPSLKQLLHVPNHSDSV